MMFGEHTVVPHINKMWNESKRDVFGMYNSTNQPTHMINVKVMLAKSCHKFAKCGMLPKWLQQWQSISSRVANLTTMF